MPGNGLRRRTGLERRDAGQRRDQNVSRLGLPPRVDDRTALCADVLVVPHPRFGIDRLADRSEQAQAAQVALRRPVGAPLHERANRRRRRVEDRDAVALDQTPEAILLRPVGRAFVHQHRRAVRQRAVHDVAVAGDPADVGGAPVHVVVPQIEDPLRRRVRADEIAAGRVDDALRLAGRAGRVEDVEHVLGVHRLRRDSRGDASCISSWYQWSRPSCMWTGNGVAVLALARRRRAGSTASRAAPRRPSA